VNGGFGRTPLSLTIGVVWSAIGLRSPVYKSTKLYPTVKGYFSTTWNLKVLFQDIESNDSKCGF